MTSEKKDLIFKNKKNIQGYFRLKRFLGTATPVGKDCREMDFGLIAKTGDKWPRTWKIGQKIQQMGFSGPFPPLFCGEAKIHFSAFFPYCGRPEADFFPSGHHVRKPDVPRRSAKSMMSVLLSHEDGALRATSEP